MQIHEWALNTYQPLSERSRPVKAAYGVIPVENAKLWRQQISRWLPRMGGGEF